MWPLVTYSNCFEIVSTVAFYSRESISLTINDDYARYSAWFLDINKII